MPDLTKITFFRTPADLRKWFQKHHATATELRVGFYKVGSGKPSITWPESVDEALCFGWIDGVRHSHRRRELHDPLYAAKGREHVERRQHPPRQGAQRREADAARRVEGVRAGARTESGIYAYEQRPTELVEPYRAQMKRNKAAWTFFEAQPPSYRKTLTWWVISAKQEETRLKRLKILIEACEAGRRLR